MPNADGRRELPRRRNSGSPTSENSENANFVELRIGEIHDAVKVRIGPGPPARGCPYHRVLCFLCTELGVVILLYIR